MSTREDRGNPAPDSFSVSRRERLVCLLFCLAAVLICTPSISSDDRFMQLHGEDILAGNLFRKTDFLSLHEDLPFLHQKWAMCLLVYAAEALFGKAGFAFGGWVLLGILVLSLFTVLNRLHPERLFENTALIMSCSLVFSNGLLASFRPHVIACTVLVWEYCFLEQESRGGCRGLAVKLFFCSLLVMWFHSTMWCLCLVPLLPYLACRKSTGKLLERLTGVRFEVRETALKRLLSGFLAMTAASLLQPAGIAQYRYMLDVLLSGSSQETFCVNEMQPLLLFLEAKNAGAWVLAGFLAAFLILARRAVLSGDRIDMAGLFWALGGTVLCLCFAVRMAFWGAVFVLLGAACRRGKPEEEKARRLRPVLAAAAVCMLVLVTVPSARDSWETDSRTQRMCDEAAEVLGPGARVMCFRVGEGCMLEQLGLKPYMDSRVELYTDRMSGDRGILDVFVRAAFGASDGLLAETVEKFDIQYVMVCPWNSSGLQGLFSEELSQVKPFYESEDLVLYRSGDIVMDR